MLEFQRAKFASTKKAANLNDNVTTGLKPVANYNHVIKAN